MSKKYLHRVIPLLTVVFLFATLVIPAFADGTAFSVVDISEAIKEVSYSNDEVYITYDIPLDPFSSIYGSEVGSDTLTHILDSTYIHFIQDRTETVSFFTDVLSYSVDVTYWHDGWSCYRFQKTFYSSLPTESMLKSTSMFVDGVEYDLYVTSNSGSCNFKNYSHSGYPSADNEFLLFYDRFFTSSPILYFMSFNSGSFDVSLGYYETEEVWAAKYDSISGVTYPLGYSPTDISGVKVIDVSDLRSGSSFDVTFDYRFDAEFEGTVSGGSLKFFAYFLDENGDLLNTVFIDQLDFTATSKSSSYSSTFTLPDDAEYFYIKANLDDLNVSECKSYEFVMSSFEVTVPVSAVEYNSKQMDEINKKLDEIKNEQQETNDKLDEIISGSPGANAGADNMQDVAGDYKDHVNNQLQNGQAQMDKLDQLPRPDVSGSVTLPEWATSDQFLGFNAVVATIWENETIYEIMVVASILMLASYILFGKKV